MQYTKILFFSILIYFLSLVVTALVTYFYSQSNSELAGITGRLLLTIYLINGLTYVVLYAIWVVYMKYKPFLSAAVVSLLVIFFDILSISAYQGYLSFDLGKLIDFFVLYFSLLVGATIGSVINRKTGKVEKGRPEPPPV